MSNESSLSKSASFHNKKDPTIYASSLGGNWIEATSKVEKNVTKEMMKRDSKPHVHRMLMNDYKVMRRILHSLKLSGTQ